MSADALAAVIEQVKQTFLQSKEGLLKSFRTTPDERVNWAPSPSSRTPAQLVAHSAVAIENIRTQLDGTPFPIKTTVEADESFRAWERDITTREQALDLLEKNSAKFLEWLDALTPEKMEYNAEMPFGLGLYPVAASLNFPSDHMRYHIAQLDYLQTIYGDQEWYLRG